MQENNKDQGISVEAFLYSHDICMQITQPGQGKTDVGTNKPIHPINAQLINCILTIHESLFITGGYAFEHGENNLQRPAGQGDDGTIGSHQAMRKKISDIQVDSRQMSTSGEILLLKSCYILTYAQEHFRCQVSS